VIIGGDLGGGAKHMGRGRIGGMGGKSQGKQIFGLGMFEALVQVLPGRIGIGGDTEYLGETDLAYRLLGQMRPRAVPETYITDGGDAGFEGPVTGVGDYFSQRGFKVGSGGS